MKYFYINNTKFNYDLEFTPTPILNQNKKASLTLIEYCETLGITIPHYCYHKKLSIAGNCRMCLVELKKSTKPVVSCAMSAKSTLGAGTEMYTHSPLIKKARENILEFLLLNHPLDCPICDQGGECDLQDQSLFFGFTRKRFYSFKRVVSDKNIGPIVKTVMTRCIHCTRCVRFATEIAGVEDLGVFGRGMNSEIGTYVNKVFQSELSGNIIDLCPVGALTSKPYPFLIRSWEVKTLSSIDISDSFGIETTVIVKNGSVVKILPNYNSTENTNYWISDKTRFIFDGMFSPNRVVNSSYTTGIGKVTEIENWESLFKDISYTFYFQDHLKRHFFTINPLIVVFDENINLEVLSLLLLLEKKFDFIKLRKSNISNSCTDTESTFQLNSMQNTDSLMASDRCLLVGLNLRYDSNFLNLKLRQRYFKGNFEIFSLGSFTDLTYPVNLLSSSISIFKKIIEGTHSICQTFRNSKKFTVVISSELFKRSDSRTVFTMLNNLKKKIESTTKTLFEINVLNTLINSVGVNTIFNFKSLELYDLKKYSGLYVINVQNSNSNIKKLLELKLLNFLNKTDEFGKIIIEQNNKIENKFNVQLRSKLNVCNYTFLPNNVFFETSNTFINAEGLTKKTVKLVSATQNTKDDWQILRKLFFYLEKINSVNSNFKSIIHYNCNKMFNFKNYLTFMYLSAKLLSHNSLVTLTKNQNFSLVIKFLESKKKIFYTNLKKWLEDFYVGTYDNYSRYSPTMVSCSNYLREGSTNFVFNFNVKNLSY